mgnify:CR=1 FL=1
MTDQKIIKIEINGKNYPISCKVGEENRVIDSANLLTEIIQSINNNDDKISESKIMLMSALILADKNIRNSIEKNENPLKENLKLDDIVDWIEKIQIKFNNIARLIDNS